MPAGAVGSSWATDSWTDTCWEENSWADLGSGFTPEQALANVIANISPVFSMQANISPTANTKANPSPTKNTEIA